MLRYNIVEQRPSTKGLLDKLRQSLNGPKKGRVARTFKVLKDHAIEEFIKSTLPKGQ